MRKFLVLCLTATLLLTALALPPLSGAARVDKNAKRGPVAPSKKEQAEGAKPVSARAVNFGESAPLSEISAAQAKVAVSKNKKPVDHEEYIEQKLQQNVAKGTKGGRVFAQDENEINRFNREITRPFDYNAKTAPDAAIAYVPGGKGKGGRLITPQVFPTPNVSFEGTSEADTVAI